MHLYFTLQTRLKSAQSRRLASSRQHIPPITTLFFLKLLKMEALVELPLFLSPSRPLSPPPPGSNQVEPPDLAFQVRLVGTNELRTSNGGREVDLPPVSVTQFTAPHFHFFQTNVRHPGASQREHGDRERARRRLRSQLGAGVGGQRTETSVFISSSFQQQRNTTAKLEGITTITQLKASRSLSTIPS